MGTTAPDKGEYQENIFNIFLISPQKHMLWYSLEAFTEALLMSSHNISFCGEIRKIYQHFFVEKLLYLELWVLMGIASQKQLN